MLKLGNPEEGWLGEIPSSDPTDPRPFLLPGVRVRFLAIGIKAVRAARRAVAIALQIDERDYEQAGDELSRELIRRGIAEWEGFGDIDGNPVDPTHDRPVLDGDDEPALDESGLPVIKPGTISLFLKNPRCFEAADRVYVTPWSNRDREKNGSAGSPNGTSTEATPAPATATISASTGSTADASPTDTPRMRKPAKAARMSRTSARPKKASKSGM